MKDNFYKYRKSIFLTIENEMGRSRTINKRNLKKSRTPPSLGRLGRKYFKWRRRLNIWDGERRDGFIKKGRFWNKVSTELHKNDETLSLVARAQTTFAGYKRLRMKSNNNNLKLILQILIIYIYFLYTGCPFDLR